MGFPFPFGDDLIDYVDDVLAEHVNNLRWWHLASAALAQNSRSMALTTDDLVLSDTDAPVQFLSGSGTVLLPAESSDNHPYYIGNTSTDSQTITVKDDSGGTIGTVARDEAKLFISNGSVWRQLTSGSSSSGGGSYATILALGG